MIKFIAKRRLIAYLIIGWAFLLGCLPANTLAMPVSSKVLQNEAKSLRQSDINKIYSLLEERNVQKNLVKMRINSNELKERIAKLPDAQIHRLANQLAKVKIGGSAGGAILIVAIVVGIIALILYFTGRSLRISTDTSRAD